MYTPLFIAFRCVFCSISQREYQQHEKIALKHFILKNWVKPIVSLALFIYDTIFSQKYLVVDILHCNKNYISNGKWLIDYKEFFKKVNPRKIRRTATMPRLRCLRDCVTEFNKNNRKYKIDKATVSHYMNSAQVTRYFHGNTWFINYDELEKVILRHLKTVKKRKKRKYNWI